MALAKGIYLYVLKIIHISFYCVFAIGGLVEEHFLICPIQHYQNSVNQPEPVRIEMNQFKKALVKFYQRESKVPIFFERNYKTSHMQLQVIPIPEKAQRELKDIFMVKYFHYSFPFMCIP